MGCLFGKRKNDSDQNATLETLINIDNLKNIDIPFIPIEIIEMIKKDWKIIEKLLEYKSDETLSLLKIYRAIIDIYDDNFNIKFEKDIKTSSEFLESTKIYAKLFTQEGLKFYMDKEKKKYNNVVGLVNEKFLGPIVEEIFNNIYQEYSKKFFFSADEEGKQNDCINIELKDKKDIEIYRYYYTFNGVILVEHTNNSKQKDEISFKVEFSGAPRFQIVVCNLNKLQFLEKKSFENLKNDVDKIGVKIIEQNINNLL
jgi:hypothetical protein